MSIMPRDLLILSLLLVPMLLGGCASGDRYRPVQIERGESVVIVYRPKSLISPGAAHVYVDQTLVGSVRKNQHLAVVVEPGEHLVRVERRGSAARRVHTHEGESSFLEIGTLVFGSAVTLEVIDPARARDRLATTRASAPPSRLNDD